MVACRKLYLNGRSPLAPQGHELRDALWVRIDGSYEDFYSSIVIDLTGRDVCWVNAADWKLVN